MGPSPPLVMLNAPAKTEPPVPPLPPLVDSTSEKQTSLTVYGTEDWPRVAPVWAHLAANSPYRSFYLSADWMGAWLEVFGRILRPQFLVFRQSGEPIGVCLLMTAEERRGIFPVSRIYLNTGGEPVSDRTFMEFNNIPCLPGKEEAVVKALGKFLETLPWDEFAAQGMNSGAVLTALQSKGLPGLPASVSVRNTFYVDLEELRISSQPYWDSISANTRSQIRRSIKRYGGPEVIRVDIARDTAEAENFFAEMCRLHQSRWRSRGEEGAFGPGRRLDFHRALIRRAYGNGSIHLLRVTAGGRTIGILYNFVQDGRVYFFQSGFHYKPDKHLKPGLVTHACAIQHYLESGYREYDFLAGEARYKASLAKQRRTLTWVVFYRPSIKGSYLELLRGLKRRIQGK